ncbi:MAG: hypothetical protein JWN17_2863, partial [Frankiales bacterium]|nr:hypothetical protein [Frankiales bacterium]
ARPDALAAQVLATSAAATSDAQRSAAAAAQPV